VASIRVFAAVPFDISAGAVGPPAFASLICAVDVAERCLVRAAICNEAYLCNLFSCNGTINELCILDMMLNSQ